MYTLRAGACTDCISVGQCRPGPGRRAASCHHATTLCRGSAPILHEAIVLCWEVCSLDCRPMHTLPCRLSMVRQMFDPSFVPRHQDLYTCCCSHSPTLLACWACRTVQGFSCSNCQGMRVMACKSACQHLRQSLWRQLCTLWPYVARTWHDWQARGITP